jgi:hypothetical protein
MRSVSRFPMAIEKIGFTGPLADEIQRMVVAATTTESPYAAKTRAIAAETDRRYDEGAA